MFDHLIKFIRAEYRTQEFIPLHAPLFKGREREYVTDTIDSTFVSSVGQYVDRFEREIAAYVGSPRAVATMNGTAALHMALLLAGAQRGDLILTQPLTFVATCNAIMYCGAEPVFVDVDRHTLGMSPEALEAWLIDEAEVSEGVCRRRSDKRVVRAALPMHTFGHPADLNRLVEVCDKWSLSLIEDAAESLGSLYYGKHTGTFGDVGVLSFNGNKIMTTGGGGMILADEVTGSRAKHLTTTAKLPHSFEYVHDELGFNYRLPNLNAALGCAQLEQIEAFVEAKRALARRYEDVLAGSSLVFVREPEHCRSNYWLNAVICEDRTQRDALLAQTNEKGVMTRPIWHLMNELAMYRGCAQGPLENARWLSDRIVNLPSSVIPEFLR